MRAWRVINRHPANGLAQITCKQHSRVGEQLSATLGTAQVLLRTVSGASANLAKLTSGCTSMTRWWVWCSLGLTGACLTGDPLPG